MFTIKNEGGGEKREERFSVSPDFVLPEAGKALRYQRRQKSPEESGNEGGEDERESEDGLALSFQREDWEDQTERKDEQELQLVVT